MNVLIKSFEMNALSTNKPDNNREAIRKMCVYFSFELLSVAE